MTALRRPMISQSTLLARINRIYGVAARVETGAGHPGYFGFIID